MARKPPEPPSTLGRKGATLWRRTLAEREFSAAELGLVEMLCACSDNWAEAQAVLKADGVTVTDRFGAVRAHPAAAIVRDSANVAARLANQLDLELEDDAPAVRHPHASRPGPRR